MNNFKHGVLDRRAMLTWRPQKEPDVKQTNEQIEEVNEVVALGSVSRDTKGRNMGLEPSGIGQFPPGEISEN